MRAISIYSDKLTFQHIMSVGVIDEQRLRANMYVFWHIFVDSSCVDRCIKIIKRQFDLICSSGLLDEVKSIHIGYVGKAMFPVPEILEHPKFKIDVHIDEGYEGVTTRLLFEKAKHELPKDACLLYIHNKGVKWPEGSPPWDWACAMEYFLVERYEQAITGLTDHMTSGPFLSRHDEPRYKKQGLFNKLISRPHWIYSGNMWWARAEYIKMLHSPPQDDRWACGEDWILGKVTDKLVGKAAFDLHQTPDGRDLYKQHYPRSMYCDC